MRDKSRFGLPRRVWEKANGKPWPENCEVDHINGDHTDHRSENIRPVTHSQNGMNKDVQSNNTSGHRCIHQTGSGNWQVRVSKDKVRRKKTVATLEQAIILRDMWVSELHGKYAGVYSKQDASDARRGPYE